MNALRSLWTEPREPDPPRRVWRDWLLVGGLVGLALVEGLLRAGLVWRPLSVILQVSLIVMLLWRRTHPLLSVAVAFGGIGLLDAAAILAGRESAGLWVMVGLFFFPYALFRWGAGREAIIGLIIMSIPHVMNMIYFPGAAEATVGGFAFLLFPSALGASVRFRSRVRSRDIAEAKLLEREQLARELHDTVAHHVSAIAIQAQAGRALAESDPGAPARVLETIEAEASRTLSEMRAIVGVLRRGETENTVQKGLDDLDRLASAEGALPHVSVDMEGHLDDVRPSIQAAVFRIAQESITNARRHSRLASEITVSVRGEEDLVSLTLTDDGEPAHFDGDSGSGFGLIGMRERAVLHGGEFEAGPIDGRGWRVHAVLPKTGVPA